MDAAGKPMGKLRASYLLATESFELFRKDKEIVWFVIWNIVSVFAVLVVAIGAGIVLVGSGAVTIPEDGTAASLGLQVFGYVALFAVYLITCFLTTYFGVALTSVVAARIEGQDLGFHDGIRAASARMGRIFGWSLLSSTVGVILQAIADRASWLGSVVSFLGSVAWSAATFFIIPVLAREDLPVGDSLKRSGETFVRTWGETLVMNFSLGLFFLGVHLALLVLFGGGAALLFSAGALILAAVVIVLYIVVFVAASIVQSVLEAVFRVVLYEYAVRGTVPDSFTPELVIGALKKKQVPAAA